MTGVEQERTLAGRLNGTVRAGLSVLVGCIVWWTGWLEAPANLFEPPGVDAHGLPAIYLRDVLPGLGPIMVAFILVEVGAAIVPRWRALRRDGLGGRARLRSVALRLSVVCVALLTLSLFPYARRDGHFDASSLVILAAAMLASVLLCLAFAQLIDRMGLGTGFAVVYVFSALGPPRDLPLSIKLTDPVGAFLPLVLVGCFVVALELAARWPNTKAWLWPVPVSSVMVLGWSTLWIEHFTDAGLNGILSTRSVMLVAAVIVGVSLVVAEIVARLPLGLRESENWRERRRAAVGVSLFVVGATAVLVYGLPLWVDAISVTGVVRGTFRPVYYATVAALLLDWFHEVKARKKLGTLVDVWEEPRGWAVVVALEALESAGIPAVPRGARFHALYQVFAPHFATRIAVRVQDTARADDVLCVALGANRAAL